MKLLLPPAGAANSSNPRQHQTTTASAHPLLKDKRILLVDDDPGVRGSLSDVLVSEGCLVIPAENGQQALAVAESAKLDLVILDLNMPVKNGWDTFERLTSAYPLLPVIIATARPNQLFTALGAGVGALLEKPMDITTLLHTMEQLLHEPDDLRLARVAGQATEFYYQPRGSE